MTPGIRNNRKMIGTRDCINGADASVSMFPAPRQIGVQKYNDAPRTITNESTPSRALPSAFISTPPGSEVCCGPSWVSSLKHGTSFLNQGSTTRSVTYQQTSKVRKAEPSEKK